MSLYDLLYLLVLTLISPLLIIRAVFDPQLRELIYRRVSGNYSRAEVSLNKGKRRFWVHGASVGEITLAIKFVQEWSQSCQDLEFVLTTNTLTALQILRKEENLLSYIAPFDFTWFIQRFMLRTGVTDLIIIETEIWPNMIREISKRGRVTFVNGRLSDRHIKRYIRIQKFLKRTLSRIDLVLAGDQKSAERFGAIGVEPNRVQFFGNLKFELPLQIPLEQLKEIKNKYQINKDQFIIVAGSVQPEEIIEILKAWKFVRSTIPEAKLFLIPRHPDKKDEIQKILEAENFSYFLASCNEEHTNAPPLPNRIHVIDLMGVLKAWYSLASVIFVGGSLCDRGGQNMLEAVAMKKPVCVGPHTTNFQQEVEILVEAKGLRIINNGDELAKFINWSYHDPAGVKQMVDHGYLAIREYSGALSKNIKRLNEIYKISGK